MFNFLVGLVIGWLAGSWYANNGGQTLPVEQLRRKASPALAESERLVEESKRELQDVLHGQSPRREHPRRPRGPSGEKPEND